MTFTEILEERVTPVMGDTFKFPKHILNLHFSIVDWTREPYGNCVLRNYHPYKDHNTNDQSVSIFCISPYLIRRDKKDPGVAVKPTQWFAPQFSNSNWFVDLESGWNGSHPKWHMERSFKEMDKAVDFFVRLVDRVAKMTDLEILEMQAKYDGRLS